MEWLTHADFDGRRYRHGTAAVVFVADWCGVSRRFLREHEATMRDFPVPFRAADASDDDDPMWDAFRFHVVPSLALFKDGELVWQKNGILGIGVTRRDVEALREKAALVAAP